MVLPAQVCLSKIVEYVWPHDVKESNYKPFTANIYCGRVGNITVVNNCVKKRLAKDKHLVYARTM